MMVQQRHHQHLFDVRRVPLAADAKRDWLDVLRGTLPPLVPPVRPRGGRRPLWELYVSAVAQGAVVGLEMGAITATLLFPIALVIGTAAGAAVGLVVAAPPSLVLAGAITALTASRHLPLRDLRQFHRDIWCILLVGVGSLDLIAVLVACAVVAEVPWRLATVALVALTAVLVMLLRPAARRIVVAYAVASGWSQLDWLPSKK